MDDNLKCIKLLYLTQFSEGIKVWKCCAKNIPLTIDPFTFNTDCKWKILHMIVTRHKNKTLYNRNPMFLCTFTDLTCFHTYKKPILKIRKISIIILNNMQSIILQCSRLSDLYTFKYNIIMCYYSYNTFIIIQAPVPLDFIPIDSNSSYHIEGSSWNHYKELSFTTCLVNQTISLLLE